MLTNVMQNKLITTFFSIRKKRVFLPLGVGHIMKEHMGLRDCGHHP